MHAYVYSVNMDTQLGQRPGTIYLHIDGNEIEGTLCILENEEMFNGELLENGKCKLQGQMITRMRTVDYTAVGFFDDKTIDLILHDERNDFHISGTAFPYDDNGISINTGGNV